MDASGREVKTIGDPTQAVPGHNIILTLDLDLQRAVEGILQKGAYGQNELFAEVRSLVTSCLAKTNKMEKAGG